MVLNCVRAKHEVVSGKKAAEGLKYSRPVGHALNFEGTEYFILKLWEKPNDTFYVSRNQTHPGSYTVFSKRIEEGSSFRFQNPVGRGSVLDDLKTHLELVFSLSRTRVYLSLFPCQD